MGKTNFRSNISLWLAMSTLLMIAPPTVSVCAATPSELLEKGIYTEETVGDLEAAIAVYEQVIKAGKESHKAAAEAQFRIGLCYEKQGKMDLAAGSFQSVVDDFPDAKEWVNQAKSHLKSKPELIDVPWGEGDELHLEMKLQTGLGIGLQVYRIEKSEVDGHPAWECNTWQIVTINGQRGKSQVFVEPKTFAPIQSTWSHTLLGKSEATYKPNEVVIKLLNTNQETTLKLDSRHFDNEQAAEVFRRLPLKVGFKSTLNVVSPLSASLVPIGLKVNKTETIKVPAGTFECFCLELDLGQTFWISRDSHRYIVRFDARGVSAELVKATHPKAGETILLESDHFETVLPPRWIAYHPTDLSKKDKERTILIDHLATIEASVDGERLEPLKLKHDSPVAWLQSTVDQIKPTLQGFILLTGGVRAIKVGGLDAAVVDTEFDQGQKRMRAQMVVVFGESSAVTLQYKADEDSFERVKPALDRIIDKLTVH